jgi:predicted ATP-grasp superfamily ATP-dependent carboligase
LGRWPWAVVGVGDSGENGLAIVRSLGRRGIPVAVVAVAGRLGLPVVSRYARYVVEVAPDLPGDRLGSTFLGLARRLGGRPVLLLDNEPMMLALEPHAEALGRAFRLTLPLARSSELTDKRKQLAVAESLGIPVPRSWYPTSWAELGGVAPAANTRLIAKPLTAEARRWFPAKVLLADDGGALLGTLGSLAQTPTGLLVQEYVEGTDAEVCVALCFVPRGSGEPLIVTGRKVRQSGRGGGGIMTVGQLCDLPAVRTAAARLIAAFGYRGPAGVEFKRAPNGRDLYFIELSPRTERFHAMAWPAGVDLGWLAYRDAVVDEAPARPTVDRTRSDYWIDFRSDVRTWRRVATPASLLRPYFGRKQWAAFAWDDPRPWLRAAGAMAGEHIGRVGAMLRRSLGRRHRRLRGASAQGQP